MADINFIDQVTVVPAAWLQDVDNVVYRMLGASAGPGGSAPASRAAIVANLGAAPAAGNAAQTFAVANATATNQAVARGQVLNTSPQLFSFAGGLAANTNYSLTKTITAPCNGFIIVNATVESPATFNTVTLAISNNGTVLTQDYPTASWSLYGFAAVSNGSVNNVNVGYTVGPVALVNTLYIRGVAFFIPSP